MCLLNLKKVIKTKNTTKLFDNEMMSSDFFLKRNKHTHMMSLDIEYTQLFDLWIFFSTIQSVKPVQLMSKS